VWCVIEINSNLSSSSSFFFFLLGNVAFPTREARGCTMPNGAGVSSCSQIETFIDPTLAGGLLAGPLDIVVSVTAQVCYYCCCGW
jgi:hypothetical protein